MKLKLRNFVIEGVACQLPRRLQATPLLQTSLTVKSSNNLRRTLVCTLFFRISS